MTIKLFVKDDCPRCPAAKHACEGIESLEVFDMGSVEGLAEASYYSVLATPTILVFDDTGSEVAAWRGAAPTRSALRMSLAG